jgi:hypothetical protein
MVKHIVAKISGCEVFIERINILIADDLYIQ